jgi:hypothetical protein
MPPLELTISPLGVGDQAQMPNNPSQPRRVQPQGRLHQHRFGLHGEVVGELLSTVGQHPGMGHTELPAKQRIRRHRQGPRSTARAVRTKLAATPAPRRNLVRSQAGVEPISWP